MSQKTAKALRRALRAVDLPDSQLMINTKSGVVRRGYGARAVLQKAKKMVPAARKLFLSGMADVAKAREAAK